jgi:hypothetical protein
MHNPSLRQRPQSQIRTQSRKSEPGAIPDSRKFGIQAVGPVLSLNGAQYNQFRIELNGVGAKISQGTLANHGLLSSLLFMFLETVLQQCGARVVQTGEARGQNR